MSQDCIQLHGGMGVAKEMSIGHYFARITTFAHYLEMLIIIKRDIPTMNSNNNAFFI